MGKKRKKERGKEKRARTRRKAIKKKARNKRRMYKKEKKKEKALGTRFLRPPRFADSFLGLAESPHVFSQICPLNTDVRYHDGQRRVCFCSAKTILSFG